jgi:ParB-like chromosome segregation protein Spo0J
MAKKKPGLEIHKTSALRVEALEPATYNPRLMSREDFEALKLSIQTYGFVEPVVVREEDGTIIGGHQRVAALRELLGAAADATQIPVVRIAGLSESKTRALNLALNRIHGDFDWTKLGTMVTAIDQEDLRLTGFDQDELEELGRLMAEPTRPDVGGASLDQQLGVLARRFKFEVGTDEDATLCVGVLKRFGMTGPGNASAAFVAALKAAGKAKRS